VVHSYVYQIHKKVRWFFFWGGGVVRPQDGATCCDVRRTCSPSDYLPICSGS
jgi:hypothetical protein